MKILFSTLVETYLPQEQIPATQQGLKLWKWKAKLWRVSKSVQQREKLLLLSHLQFQIQGMKTLSPIRAIQESSVCTIPLFYYTFWSWVIMYVLRPVNPMVMSPLLHLCCCKINFLNSSNCVQNTIMVDMVLNPQMVMQPQVLWLGRIYISRIHVYSNEAKIVHIP